MAPKTRGARKREEGEDAGGKEAGKRGGKKTQRRGKKYIGAHVSIQGKVFGHFGRFSGAEFTQNCALVLQGGSGKLWSPV